MHFSRARRSGPAARPAEGVRAGISVTRSPRGLDGGLIARTTTTLAVLPRKGREPRPPHLGLRLPSPPQASPAFTLPSVRRGTAGGGSGEVARGASGHRAKLGACSTRLETRTKESNGPASQGASRNPRGAMKVKVDSVDRGGIPCFLAGAHHRPAISAPLGVAEAERAR